MSRQNGNAAPSEVQTSAERVPADIQQTPFALDDVQIDPREGTLERAGDVVRLQPKVMEVLVFLAQHHGQVVSKETLLENVWAGRFVVDGVLRRCILRIRKALDEDARAPRYLETLPRRGYRLLVAPRVAAATPPAAGPSVLATASGVAAVVAEPSPRQPDRSPFRGLEAFDAEHAEFFFGRVAEQRQSLSALKHQLHANRGFVLLLGPSGSGKSSLARAAVLPALVEDASLDVPGPRFACEFTVSSNPTEPLRQFARNVAGALAGDASTEALEACFCDDTEASLEQLTQLLDHHDPQARLVVLLDQLEEWFSYPDIGHATRTHFFDLVYALARSGRIWFVASMRSEFYPSFMQFESLRYLKSPAGQVDISFPRASQIAEIVRRPALLAGLEFGADDAGRTLDQDLIDAAASSPASLPLLEFALEQLFWRRSGNTLRHSDLAALGGLEGCLGKQAEDTYLSLSAQARSALPSVLESMLMVGGDMDRVTRRAAPLALFADNAAATEMVTAMIEARLFATQLDHSTGRPVVQFAHEAVLSHWQRARTWIEQNAATLRFRAWLSESAQRWHDGGQTRADLIARGSTLVEAARLTREDPTVGALEQRFVEHSQRQANRQARQRRLVTVAMAVLTISAIGFAISAVRQSGLAKQRQAIAALEATRAQSATDFMANLFEGADPGSNEGQMLSAGQLLDRGAERVEDALADLPESKAALMTTIAEAYVFLGDTDKARELVERAVLIARDIDPAVSRVPTDVAAEMAGILLYAGDYDGALESAGQAEQQAHAYGEPWLVIRAQNLRGRVLYQSDKIEEAANHLEKVLAQASNLKPVNHRYLAGVHNNLAMAYLERGNTAAAEPHLMRAIELDENSGDARLGARAVRLNNLAVLWNDQRRPSEALDKYHQALELVERAYGPSHRTRIRTLLNIGTLQMRLNGLEPALEPLRQASQHSATSNPTIDALVKAKTALCAELLGADPALGAALTDAMVEHLSVRYGEDHRVVAEAVAAQALHSLRSESDPDQIQRLRTARDRIAQSDDAIPAVIDAIDRVLRGQTP